MESSDKQKTLDKAEAYGESGSNVVESVRAKAVYKIYPIFIHLLEITLSLCFFVESSIIVEVL